MNANGKPRAFYRTPSGITGSVMLLIVIAAALLGPLFAPYGYSVPVGAPGQPPSGDFLLGTDFLGRDVLSRVLYGGSSVLWMGTLATVLTYIIGIAVGVLAGYHRSIIDPILMRSVDILLALPSLLVLLLLLVGLGNHIYVVILGSVLVLFPGVSRVIRAATQEVSTRGFVDAAVARGERTITIVRHDILPNIFPVVLADFGVRYGLAIILIATVNFLGLGLQPPAADWGLMISENLQFITLNPWGALAPAVMLGFLTLGVNVAADAYVSHGRSGRKQRRRASGSPAAAGGSSLPSLGAMPLDVPALETFTAPSAMKAGPD